MPRRINHYRRVLAEHNINRVQLIPGMIVSFRYNSSNRYDPRPLILFLYEDKSAKLIHGLNLNYIQEADVQKIFTMISKQVNIELNYDVFETGSTMVKLNKNPKSRVGVGAEKLYERLIKPRIFNIERTKNCYRTYKSNKVSSIKIINYRLDVVEKTIRESTKISKHKLKSNELFKNVEEQKIDIKTENVRTDTQAEIRKEE